MVDAYFSRIQELEKKVQILLSERKNYDEQLLRQLENLSSGIAINNLKVNNIQSGAAFNIAERLICTTRSDMDMDLGPNSMNVGDYNQMNHTEDFKIKLPPPQEI